jgi:AcrR family transcriptional regulator
VTARAVAERAGTHAGLLHYHFGGLPPFRREVAAAAMRQLAGPVLALLTAAPEWTSGLESVLRAAAEPKDARAARVSAELIAASLHDAEIAELMRGSLAEARDGLIPWLRRTGAAEPSGVAVLLLGALDGLLLHQLLDPALRLRDAAAAAASLSPAVQETPAGGRRARRRT